MDSAARLSRLRRRTGSAIAHGFFHGLATAGSFHPRAKPDRHHVERLRDVPYAQTGLPEHHLDVYRPLPGVTTEVAPGPGGRPVVLYVHGGGFRILSKDTHWIMGLVFARRGYVVFNISYRLAPRDPFPAAVEDAARALSWVVDNAPRYGGDPSRLILAGESAGGNLVTSLAVATSFGTLAGDGTRAARTLFDRDIRPQAVLPACGLLQTSVPDRFQKRWPHMTAFVADRIYEASEAYLGPHVDVAGRHDLADPLLLLERDVEPDRPLPPFFAACGLKDPLLDDTRRLQAALERRGVPCRACFYPGELHAFHALVWRKNARRCWSDTFAFLDEHVGR